MLYKYLGYDLFKRTDIKIAPHQLSVDLITPRAIATIVLGIFIYTNFVQPQTRLAVAALQKNTTIFIKLLLKSRQLQKKVIKYLTFFGILSTLNSFYITKQKFWILGALSFSSIFLFDYFFLFKIQKNLENILQKKERLNEKKLVQREVDLPKDWKSKYSYRLFIGILTCSLLYLAQLKFSQGYNLKLKMKN